MEERARRIVETAVELAEKGGFEAVRLRDVASHAGVALGTLYRRFRSKEDLLLAALELQIGKHEQLVERRPPQGASALERLTDEGVVPILPCIGWNRRGEPYNISSNSLSGALARAVGATKLIFPDDHWARY